MVIELIDELNDEQRMCVILHYHNEMSAREIARALEISENTVKSRLRLAKQNMARSAEKKGFRLYGLSPLPFLLFFLRREAEACSLTGTETAQMVSAALAAAGTTATTATTTATAASATAATGFASTLGSKIALGLAAAVLAGSIGVGGYVAAVKLPQWLETTAEVMNQRVSAAPSAQPQEETPEETPAPSPEATPTPTPEAEIIDRTEEAMEAFDSLYALMRHYAQEEDYESFAALFTDTTKEETIQSWFESDYYSPEDYKNTLKIPVLSFGNHYYIQRYSYTVTDEFSWDPRYSTLSLLWDDGAWKLDHSTETFETIRTTKKEEHQKFYPDSGYDALLSDDRYFSHLWNEYTYLNSDYYFEGCYNHAIIFVWQNEDGSVSLYCNERNGLDRDYKLRWFDTLTLTCDEGTIFDLEDWTLDLVAPAHSSTNFVITIPAEKVKLKNSTWSNVKTSSRLAVESIDPTPTATPKPSSTPKPSATPAPSTSSDDGWVFVDPEEYFDDDVPQLDLQTGTAYTFTAG